MEPPPSENCYELSSHVKAALKLRGVQTENNTICIYI